jgi:hypothetical protein
MKYILPVFIFLLTAYSGVAQKIVASPSIVEQSVVADLSDFSTELELPGKITNTSDQTIQIKWSQTLWDQPFEWQTEISDKDNYYLADQKGYTDNDFILPLSLEPGESFDLTIFIYPNGRAGTATYAIDIIDTKDPSAILETMVFYMSIEHLDKGDAITIRNVKVFPNPARDYFELTPNQMVDKITLYNSIGQRVKTFVAERGVKYDVTSIPNGLYLVELMDEKGKTLKTVRLLKRSLKA